MGWAFASVAGVFAWVGWFSVAPALGLPSLGPAAMFNRVAAPRADSGYWLGWALLFIGLAIAILVYVAAVRRGLWRASIVSGLVYGAFCWLVAGVAVMPVLGLLDPFPVPAPPAQPDAMHGSLMMLHLGIGAPLAALIPWLVVGAVLGATADWRPAFAPRTWAVLYGATAVVVAVIAIAGTLTSVPTAASGASGARFLSSGPVAALPDGPVFVSVFRLPQSAGATLGPHAHVPGFACTLRGVETMTFADAPAIRVGPGQAGFMGAQQIHTHLNVDDLFPAASVAVLLVVTAGVVAVLGASRTRLGARLLAGALIVLAALGAVASWNPWQNDWLFVSVRPVAARGGPMPLPSASRVYESPDLAPLPPGPYTESVQELTIPAGSTMAVQSDGATMLLVLEGQASIEPAGQVPTVIGVHQATLVQPGSSAQLVALAGHPVRVLEFTIAPA